MKNLLLIPWWTRREQVTKVPADIRLFAHAAYVEKVRAQLPVRALQRPIAFRVTTPCFTGGRITDLPNLVTGVVESEELDLVLGERD